MSAIPIQQTDSVISELPQPKGPGARLKAARQAKQLDLDLVAAHLHLSHDMIVALEADDYEQLPARVFVVGYLRNYARHVGLPPEAIIQALNNYLPAEETKTELPKVGNDAGDVFKPAVRAKRSSFSFFSLVFLVGAIALFFAWQKGYIAVSDQLMPAQSDIDASEQSLSLPSSTLMLPEAALTSEAAAVPAEPAEPAANSVDSVVPASDKQEAIAQPADVAVENDQPVVVAEPAAQPAPTETQSESLTIQAAVVDETTQAVSVVAQQPEILLSFSEVCWVDIRDSAGTYKYVNQVKPGTVKKLSGTAPYKILLGNANGVALTINGEPFDLQRYTKANVARFSLDPAAL